MHTEWHEAIGWNHNKTGDKEAAVDVSLSPFFFLSPRSIINPTYFYLSRIVLFIPHTYDFSPILDNGGTVHWPYSFSTCSVRALALRARKCQKSLVKRVIRSMPEGEEAGSLATPCISLN